MKDGSKVGSRLSLQHTLAAPVTVEGTGLHTGSASRTTLAPAPAGHGLRFFRVDLPGGPELTPEDLDGDPAPGRTSLRNEHAHVETIEHVLAALAGAGVDNARVELDCPEPPVGDGSASLFTEAIERAGVVPQEAARECYVIREPIVVGDEAGARLVALPRRPASPEGPVTEFCYWLDYGDSTLARGWAEFALRREGFASGLAPARTFCMAGDVERLLAEGLGRGASHENTLVIDGRRVVGNELRFPDEPVRHKLLDMVGDLGLLGQPLVGRIVGFRSGHRLNAALVREVRRAVRAENLDAVLLEPASPETGGARDVERMLPHRYPFLLIDSVVEVEPEKRAVAVKNVSRNEEYFRGHFPGNPIMPGVLQVEALAQTAGLVLTSYVRAGATTAALVGLDRVKMRRPVVPGDRLLLEVELRKKRRTLAVCEGRATVGGEIATEATLLLGLVRG